MLAVTVTKTVTAWNYTSDKFMSPFRSTNGTKPTMDTFNARTFVEVTLFPVVSTSGTFRDYIVINVKIFHDRVC